MKKRSGKDGGWQDFTGEEEIVTTNPSALTDGQAVTAAGIWFTVRSQANTPAQATMMRICPVNITVAAAASTMSRQLSSRKTKAVTNAA